MASMDEHSLVFREEALELLTELEATLLELETVPEDSELIGRAFRALHTIKGSGSMFSFDDVAEFTHKLETVFDLVRTGEMFVTSELIDLTLRARDHIRILLDAATEGTVPDKEPGMIIIEALEKLIPDTAESAGSSPESRMIKEESLKEEQEISTYRIRFKPNKDIFLHGTNPLYLLNELRDMGTCLVTAHTDKVPDLAEINPEFCYTVWDIILSTHKDINAIRDVFIFVEDECDLTIDLIDRSGMVSGQEEYKRLGEILVERGDIQPEDLSRVLESKKLIGEMLVETGLVTGDKVESALAEQQHVKDMRKDRVKTEGDSTVKVPSSRLDKLVDLVGELVIAQARLSQIASAEHNSDIASISEVMERLTADLRDTTLNIRMLPIGTTFGKFKRLVRDLSRELGREVEMTTDGAETELDKTVIEKLNDPLVHLIRNAIDHGIELPEDRELKGKPRQGTVHLSALHSGANVLISIRDDGMGLNSEAIFAKAVERGLVQADAQLSEKEIYNFILHPGFSTASTVTSVSGRGVGMDVVKQCITSLRGTVEITSTPGVGTNITLKLPLTLAIIEGLLVQIGEAYYVLPLAVVEECIELTKKEIADTHGRNLIRVRGEIIPYILLRNIFHDNSTAPPIQQVVVTRIDGARIGFTVDRVIGEHQTVIKSLGRVYRNVHGVSGATILGDGNVALILDIPQIMEEAQVEESVFCGSR